jgi:hypothetical protein
LEFGDRKTQIARWETLASASEGIPRTINLVARAAWIQAAKDKSLQISATHLQSALELVPDVMEIRIDLKPDQAKTSKIWSQLVRELHELYCHWTAQTLSLRFDRERALI